MSTGAISTAQVRPDPALVRGVVVPTDPTRVAELKEQLASSSSADRVLELAEQIASLKDEMAKNGAAPAPAPAPAADRFLDALFVDEYALPGLDDEPALDALFADEYAFPGLDDEPAVDADADLEKTIAAKIAALG